MYRNEQFDTVANVETGFLVLKLPGTDFKLEYQSGTAHVNKEGNVGYVALNLTDVVAQEAGESTGMMGMLGEQLREQMNDPDIKKAMREAVQTRPLALFYSRTKDGKEIITIPGLSGKQMIDDESLESVIVASYSLNGTTPSIEEVYALHTRAAADRDIVNDKTTITEGTRALPQKANNVYEKALEIMKELGF